MAEPGRARQSPGRRRRGVATLLLAGVLASCSTLVPRGKPPPGAPPPAAPVPAPTAPAGLPEDRERHRVALLVPLSGPNAGVGQSIANAAVLALGDSKDRALRVTTYDTGAGAAGAAQKALADGNRLFLGPLLGEDVRAVAGAAAAAHVPVIAFSNDATAAGDDVWLLGFQLQQSIDRVVRYARGRGLSRFAGLVPQGAYGRNASGALLRAVEAAGGSVVAMQGYDRTPGSIRAAVASIAKQKYDAVLIADSGRVAVAAAPLIRRSGGTAVRLMGTELWNAEPGLGAAAPLAGAWFASVPNGVFDQLAERYRVRYARTPYRLASLGYDAVLLTVRIAADWPAGAPFPVERLDDPSGFSGIDGAFRFAHGHVAERALAVQQLGPGGGVVAAAPTGFEARR